MKIYYTLEGKSKSEKHAYFTRCLESMQIKYDTCRPGHKKRIAEAIMTIKRQIELINYNPTF